MRTDQSNSTPEARSQGKRWDDVYRHSAKLRIIESQGFWRQGSLDIFGHATLQLSPLTAADFLTKSSYAGMDGSGCP